MSRSERSVLITDGDVLTSKFLPTHITRHVSDQSPAAVPALEMDLATTLRNVAIGTIGADHRRRCSDFQVSSHAYHQARFRSVARSRPGTRNGPGNNPAQCRASTDSGCARALR